MKFTIELTQEDVLKLTDDPVVTGLITQALMQHEALKQRQAAKAPKKRSKASAR
jgi:hypothetical protein